MPKITFMGAGSTVFARNVLGDCMCTPSLCESEIALYDIDAERLEESYIILSAINKNTNGGKATLKTYCGVENRKEALRGADFVCKRHSGRLLRPVHNHRFRGAEEVRSAPDDCRYDGHWRHHACTAYHSCFGRFCPRHGRSLPERMVPQLHKPDGNAFRLHATLYERKDRRPLPQRAGLL